MVAYAPCSCLEEGSSSASEGTL